MTESARALFIRRFPQIYADFLEHLQCHATSRWRAMVIVETDFLEKKRAARIGSDSLGFGWTVIGLEEFLGVGWDCGSLVFDEIAGELRGFSVSGKGGGAAFEAGFDPGWDVWGSVERTVRGVSVYAIGEPGIGLVAGLACEAGDVSCVLH